MWEDGYKGRIEDLFFSQVLPYNFLKIILPYFKIKIFDKCFESLKWNHLYCIDMLAAEFFNQRQSIIVVKPFKVQAEEVKRVEQ